MAGISLDRAMSWVVAILVSSGLMAGLLIWGHSVGQQILLERLQSVENLVGEHEKSQTSDVK